jgi:dihydroxyacetone kinase-like protein
MALSILDDGPYTRTLRKWDRENAEWVEHSQTDEPFHSGDEVLAFVNSMGGTPLSELFIVFRKLEQVLEKRGIRIVRNLIGPYVTSLEMQGVSITLLKTDAEILRFWDAPVHTPGLRWGV